MTRQAKVYVIQREGTVKVGFSTDPVRRAKAFGRCAALAHATDEEIDFEDARRLERLAHRVLVLSGKHIRGEWFSATVEDAVAAIEIAMRQASNVELKLGGDVPRHCRPRPETVLVTVTMPQGMVAALDAIVAADAAGTDRSSVIRQLVAEALAARGKGKRS